MTQIAIRSPVWALVDGKPVAGYVIAVDAESVVVHLPGRAGVRVLSRSREGVRWGRGAPASTKE